MRDPMITVLTRWPDDIYDNYAEPVYGAYSRAAWLPRLGPTSWLLWTTLASRLVVADEDVTIDLGTIATSLGVGSPGRHGWALTRSVAGLFVISAAVSLLTYL